jgi:hypothetical protein
LFFLFLFLATGSGAYPHAPRWAGGEVPSEMLQSVGFKEPDDVSIQAAIEANDAFIERLQQIRDSAQGLTIDQDDR